MKLIFRASILILFFAYGCQEDDLANTTNSRLENKEVTKIWETELGIGFGNLIANGKTVITRGRIDGADKIVIVDTKDGSIVNSFNAIYFRSDRLFKSTKWLTSSNSRFSIYGIEDGTYENITLNFFVNDASCLIDSHLYFAGRYGPSENSSDHNFLRYNIQTEESEYLHFACENGFNSFRPHFFIVPEQANAHFYYVYGKDSENPFSLTFTKFDIATKTSRDLFNFQSAGVVSHYTLDGNKLTFMDYERTTVTMVDLDREQKISTVNLEQPASLVERSDYSDISDDGILTLYSNKTGKKIWSRDHSDLLISSNIAVDENYAYVTGYKTLYVLDKTDGEIVFQEELAFLEGSSENGLDQKIYSPDNGSLVIKNSKKIYRIAIQ